MFQEWNHLITTKFNKKHEITEHKAGERYTQHASISQFPGVQVMPEFLQELELLKNTGPKVSSMANTVILPNLKDHWLKGEESLHIQVLKKVVETIFPPMFIDLKKWLGNGNTC